jgi:hypothetical protein
MAASQLDLGLLSPLATLYSSVNLVLHDCDRLSALADLIQTKRGDDHVLVVVVIRGLS